jgi:group I intron endonuclease
MIVYKITNKINGKIYIGQTVRPFNARWTQHCRVSKTGLGAAIKKYGKENFSHIVLSECQSIEQLNDAEEYFIEQYQSLAPHGYNLNTGGRNRIPTVETRKRQSEAQKKVTEHAGRWVTGNSGWPVGKKRGPMSLETKALMSKQRKGRIPWNKGLKSAC